jgi:hypothetical protein
MPAPQTPRRGTQSRRDRLRDQLDPDRITPKAGKKTKASQPGSDGRGNKKPKKGKTPFDIPTLNPPFDPRMRRIGSPLNLTTRIKRGWVQSKDGTMRVDFLFNPPQLDLQHQIDPNVPTGDMTTQTPDTGGADFALAATNSSTSVKLLYDRTYELFSAPKGGKLGFANQYGVWADVAAWYYFFDMLPAYPTSWDDSILTGPMVAKEAYLFMGAKMVYFGRIDSMNVTYSHWTQEMVPARCAVDLGMTVLPHTGESPLQGQAPIDLSVPLVNWWSEWSLSPDGLTVDPQRKGGTDWLGDNVSDAIRDQLGLGN